MIYTTLCCSAETIGPKGKLILLALAVRYPEGETPPIDLDELADELKHPAHMVRGAVHGLIDRGLLGTKSLPDGRGRPKRVFRLQADVIKKLSTVGVLEGEEKEAVIALIQKGAMRRPVRDKQDKLIGRETGREEEVKRRRLEGRTSYLDAVDILLLGVLLAASNHYGVVKGWGLTQLASICGVSILALKGRLRKLLYAGVIRQLVPGVASPLFSQKLKTVIILNLNHDVFGVTAKQAQVIVHRYNYHMEGEFSLVSGLFVDARNDCLLQSRSQMRRLFKTAPSHAFEQIEFFLYEQAAAALEQLLRGPFRQVEKDAIENIALESARKFFKNLGREADEAFEELISIMGVLVYQVVMEWSERIRPHIHGPLLKPKVMIMPGYTGRGYQCIAMMLWREGEEEPSLVIDSYPEPAAPGIDTFKRETDIPEEIRVAAGLIQLAVRKQ